MVNFIREQHGWPIVSPTAMTKMSGGFRKAVEQFAVKQGLKIVSFEKGERKEELAQAALAGFTGKSEVCFTYSRQRVNVTHFYFYILDEDFGLAFIKVCTYLPFEVKVCCNGHEWA